MNEQSPSDQPLIEQISPTLLSNLDKFITFFDEKFEGITHETLIKFMQIKELIASKTLNTQQLHDKIKELLDISELYDLLRLERWPYGVLCIYCGHEKIIKLGKFLNKNKYLCEKCHQEFFDDSDTPLEPDRVMIAIMLHLLLANGNKEDIINFLKNTYGYRKEYLQALIPVLQKDNLLGESSEQAVLRCLSFKGLENLTITEFRKGLTSGILHDALIIHTRGARNGRRSK